MNTINRNYNYNYNNSYNNYRNYGSYGSSLNFGNVMNVANQANVAGNTYLNSNTDSNKGFFSRLFDGGMLGGISSVAGRVWSGISNNSTNLVKACGTGLKNIARSVGLLFAGTDIYKAYQNDVAAGRNPWSLDGTMIRKGTTSIASNTLAGLCGFGAGAVTSFSGPGAIAAGAGAGYVCYEGADALGNYLWDQFYDARETENNSINFYN